MRSLGRCLARGLMLAVAVPAAGVAQERKTPPSMTEREAAAALADGRLTPERDRALTLALELGPRAGPGLRGAVIGAAWAELRGETDRPEGSEAIFDYLHAVAQLREPQAVPFLIEALVYGSNAANALADLAPGSFPAVVEAVSNSGSHPHRVGEGLTALRFMVEDGSLHGGQVALVREAVRERLSGTQGNSVVKAAVRLALTLGDPELRGIVETLATDRGAVELLVSPYLADGVTRTRYYDGWIDSVQEDARLLLNGGGADIGPFRRPFPRD